VSADTDEDDRALLAAHAAGDRHAFGRLVTRHQERLWAVAVRTLGDREEAADALQDALCPPTAPPGPTAARPASRRGCTASS
jgi:hypothetical protein